MAIINATFANEDFLIEHNRVALSSGSGSGSGTASTFNWTTIWAGAVLTEGIGYAYSGSTPIDGTVNRVRINLSAGGQTDIEVTGIALDLEQLAQPGLNAEAFVNAFWLELLSGHDEITGANGQTFTMAGDARNVAAGFPLFGMNDRMTGGTGGNSGQTQNLFGDAYENLGTVVGGDDVIVGRGQFTGTLVGDVDRNRGVLVGGDDILRFEAVAVGAGNKVISGDARITDSGTVFGGDDHITGSAFADTLVGDVYEVLFFSTVVGGDDTIFGGAGNDRIHGDRFRVDFFRAVLEGGDDKLFGGDGDDELRGNEGSDFIDGGAGNDTAAFNEMPMFETNGAALVKAGGTLYVPQIVDGSVDTLVNVEIVELPGSTVAVSSIAAFDGLNYVARYGDLITAFRGFGSADAINNAGAQHYAFNGYFEGRAREGSLPFDPVQYKANYGDLAGLSDPAATLHYIQNGLREGRLGLDAMAYIASWADLRAAFGTNEAAAVQHWQTSGRAEGRTVTFDAKQYLDNYADIAGVLGTNNLAGAAQHFVQFGANEGRTDIDPLDYVASYGDLIQAFGDFGNAPVGNINTAGLAHYAQSGRAEGRDASFDAWQYLNNYDDLTAVFGTDVDAAAHHFIQFGFYEGRTDDPFFG